MSIKILYSKEKTNSFRPTPWHWSGDQFPAYRGGGFRHKGFLAVGRDYPEPIFVDGQPSADGYGCPQVSFEPSASKLIKTKAKGTLMLVPCAAENDEQILLITLRGGFRGGYSRIEAVGAEVMFQKTSGGHCLVTGHLVVRLTHPKGYVFAETGRRCSQGLVEVFSWDGYQTMPTEEFEVWQETHAPDVSDAAAVRRLKAKVAAECEAACERANEEEARRIAEATAKAEAEMAAEESREKLKPILVPRLEAVSDRRETLGL